MEATINNYPIEGDAIDPLKNEAELSAIAQAARQSVDRTVRKLDETIAYVNCALTSMRKAK